VGALLARNVSGPLRHRYGAPRDLVLGVTLVLADGTVSNAGGKVVKNVAGYDLARLVCGSAGRLAVVAHASFRLHPLPRAMRTLVLETGEAAAVAESVLLLLRSQLRPSALDVLHPRRVAVLFEGSERAVEAQLASARRLVGGEVAEPEPEAWEESRSRQAASRGRVRFAPGELAETLTLLEEAVVRPAAGVAYVPHPVEPDTPDGVARLQETIRRAFDPRGVLSG
jgi:glycolate oxidase FAD binding subunit